MPVAKKTKPRSLPAAPSSKVKRGTSPQLPETQTGARSPSRSAGKGSTTKAPPASASKAPARNKGGRPKGPAKPKLPETIGTTELAKLLSITDRRLTQLVDEGVIEKEGRGAFNTVAAVAAFVNFRAESEKRRSASTSADKLREQRQEEIARKMAREDREIIALDEAMDALDEAAGLFVEVIGGLPARITRDPKERRRIEDVCNAERDRLSQSFAEKAQALRTGLSDAEDPEEDDA